MLDKGVRLVDYECLTLGGKKYAPAPVAAVFGKYAGRAGAIDFIRGLGERMLGLGYATPFLHVRGPCVAHLV